MQTHISLSLSLCVFLFFFFFFFFFFFRLREREKDINPFSSRLPSLFFPRVYTRAYTRARGYYAARARARGTFHDGERPRRRTHPSREEHLSFSFKEERKKDEAECLERGERERERHARVEEEELLFFAYFPPFFRLLFFENCGRKFTSLALFQNTLHHYHINRALLKQKEKCR